MKKMLSKIFLGAMVFSMIGQTGGLTANERPCDRFLDTLFNGMPASISEAEQSGYIRLQSYLCRKQLGNDIASFWNKMKPNWGEMKQKATLSIFDGGFKPLSECLVFASGALLVTAAGYGLYKLIQQFRNKRRAAKTAKA